ncbi:hypothetical protein UFOVP77_32 [uncultured Caudovirales phage]|uniref:Uncharacterized protein n=1 Tax=uncultured Caudovirales phage TaxID=2100421 RepID=A0A6J5L0Z0_9CAUD|nr:hypothetical protein UFOVP77_32 [uncultured Caudovirales phage]
MKFFMQNEKSEERQMADQILAAVREGDGHMFTPAEIDWALGVTGDMPVAENAMMVQN